MLFAKNITVESVCWVPHLFLAKTNSFRAVLELNPDALDIAEAADMERQHGIVRGPLHGIPFFVKDNIGSKDKMQTTASSMACYTPAN